MKICFDPRLIYPPPKAQTAGYDSNDDEDDEDDDDDSPPSLKHLASPLVDSHGL